jgi:hypothetical protein
MRRRTRPLALAAAAALAVGTAVGAVSSQAVTTGEPVGYLTLSATSTPAGAQVRYFEETTPVGDAQNLVVRSNCEVDPASAAGPWATVTTGGGTLGFRENGLGVRAKNGGTNCGQVSGTQTLTFALGSSAALVEKAISRAELDIESKFSCRLAVTYRLDGLDVGSEVVRLSSRSDCGPDAGQNDNSRVVLPAAEGLTGTLFDEITLAASSGGAISLEGGVENPIRSTDGGILGTSASVFRLVSYQGIDCLESDTTVRGLTLTRTDETADCRLIPYSLTRVDNTIDLIKDVGTQTGATFSLEVNDWDPEPTAYPVPATSIDYTPDSETTAPTPMVMCAGDETNPSLPEDLNPTTPAVVDGWCVVKQSAVIVGGGQMQVTETLYGQGDPRFAR